MPNSTIVPMETILMTPEATAALEAAPASLSSYWWYFALFGLFFVLLTFVQVLFSKAQSKTSGLILPGVSFGSALFAVVLLLLTGSSIDFMSAFKTFLLLSAPAFVWLAVYIIVRIIIKNKK